MQDYIERHRILFIFILPITIFGGIVVTPFAFLALAVGIAVLFMRDEHDSIVLLFIFLLLTGDSRLMSIQFVKDLRAEALVMIFIISLYEINHNRYRPNALMLTFIPFALVCFLGLIYSPKLSMGLNKMFSFFMFYFVCFNYIHHKFERYGRQMMIDILYLIVAVLVVSFLLLPVFPDYLSYGGARFNGLMGNPNGMGMLVTLSLPMAWYLFHREKSFGRGFKLVTYSLMIVALMMCSSRNAIFSVVLFLLLLFGMSGSTFRRVAYFFVIIPGLAVIMRNIDLEQLIIQLGLDGYFRVSEFKSGSGRVFAWRFALELFSQSPLIGCGFACEEYTFATKTNFQLWHSGHQGGVHNSYLTYLVNTGVVGTAMFYGFLLNTARKVRNLKFIFPFIACVLFSAMFESWMFSSLSAFHVLFVVTLVYAIVDTNSEQLLVSTMPGDFSNQAADNLVR